MSEIPFSLYANYARERLRNEFVVEPWGFIQYAINLPLCWINEIYVEPEFRRSKKASELADRVAQIALNAGCDTLAAQVWTEALNASDSAQTILRYGFKITSATNGVILFEKKLGGA